MEVVVVVVVVTMPLAVVIWVLAVVVLAVAVTDVVEEAKDVVTGPVTERNCITQRKKRTLDFWCT